MFQLFCKHIYNIIFKIGFTELSDSAFRTHYSWKQANSGLNLRIFIHEASTVQPFLNGSYSKGDMYRNFIKIVQKKILKTKGINCKYQSFLSWASYA